MWNSSNPRSRTSSANRKKDRDKDRYSIHFKRTLARLEHLDSPGAKDLPNVRLLLNDFSPVGMGVFISAPLIPGQELYFILTHPLEVKLKARVIWCQETLETGHILSNEPFSYRAGLEFILTPEDTQKAQTTYEQIQKSHLNGFRQST